jgi:hypothetical protein
MKRFWEKTRRYKLNFQQLTNKISDYNPFLLTLTGENYAI